MSRRITIEFSDEDFIPIEAAAQGAQMPVEQWIAHQVRDIAPTEQRYREALERLLEVTGSVNGDLGSADNEAIDRDLAREYGPDQSDAA